MVETVQLKLSHHLHGVVERVNERNGPFVGLLMTSPTEEITLQVSGFSVPSSDFLELAGSWKWKNFKSKKGALSELKFGDYNLPIKGENLLAELEFTPVQLYSTGRPMQELFCLETDPKWFNLATQLQEAKLQWCLNETYCLPEKPKVT